MHFCLRAEVIVIGIHDEDAGRGDTQTFKENMNLAGCWNHKPTVS